LSLSDSKSFQLAIRLYRQREFMRYFLASDRTELEDRRHIDIFDLMRTNEVRSA